MKHFLMVALAAFSSLAVLADEDMVKYRQEVMSAIGGTMGAIGKILKQEVERQADIAPLAVALNELATTAQNIFPEGSNGGAALDEIWQEPDEFNDRLTAFLEATRTFRKAAKSGDMAQIAPAIGQVGRTCRGCHQNYRE